jgi:hypothetical protein
MDIIYEVKNRFRITYIPFNGERPLREPFLINYRTEGVEKAEAVQLPMDLFLALVGCPAPDLFMIVRPYLNDSVAMSDGLLSELLAAPRSLATLSYSETTPQKCFGLQQAWVSGRPALIGKYLWRAAPGEAEHHVDVLEESCGDRTARMYRCFSLTEVEFEDYNRGQWKLLETA